MKRKLGINIHHFNGTGLLDALDLIRSVGFETFFTGPVSNEQAAAVKEKADRLGLEYEFIHAPFAGINDMWHSGMGYLTIYNGIKESIDVAANNGIRSVITHVSSGWNAPAINDIGLARFDELVLYAKEKGVILAFENLRVLGNLAYLVDRYAHVDNVRFCFDCGHEHCYTKTVSWLDIFVDKVICTHIHDNHSRTMEDKVSDGDEHLLPFDGTYDYAQMIRKMDQYNYTGSLMLEVNNFLPKYKHMSAEEFAATAYERIKKISEL